MRVGILINSLECGGAQTQAIRLMEGLTQQGIKTYLFLLDQTEEILLSQELKSKIIKLSHSKAKANTLKKILLAPYQWIELNQKIKKLQINTLISFMERANIITLSSRVRKKVIRSSTNINAALCFKPPLKRWLIKLVYPFLLQKADTIVFNSKGSALGFAQTFPIRPQKVKIIYNICNLEKVNLLAKQSIPQNFHDILQKRVIITVGRLIQAKGHWHLLRAFQKVCQNNKDVQLVILGDGPLQDYLNELANNLGIKDKVSFLGFQPNPMPWIAKAKLFVLSSLWEGFPNVLLEAMALGTPVVSVDCFSGPREVLAPNTEPLKQTKQIERAPFGLLTPPLDGVKYAAQTPLTASEHLLAQAIEKMLNDIKLQTYYAQAALKRAQDFSVKQIISKWLEVI